MKDTCTDQEHNKCNAHSQDRALDGCLDIDGLIVHKDKFLIKVCHDDATRAVYQTNLVYPFRDLYELIILHSGEEFRKCSILQGMSIPAQLF